jgi:aspartate aminotransferase
MSQGFSPNLQHLETSATIAISQEAKRRRAAGEDVIDLGAGEPDFPTPPIPAEAGIRAVRDGKTHYPANEGILELRAAAAKHLSLLSGGRPVNADNIVISNGSKQSLFNVCFSLFGPGDVVAIPAPAWVSYPQIVHLARARPVLVPGDPEWSLKVGVRDLERVVPGTQGLILCSPCNPTGAVYTHAEIKAIAQWAAEKKVWVIADEIYRRIHYGTGPAPSFLDLPDELLERVVIIYGVSKAYAMTGWRIGIALAPGKVAKTMAALQSHTTTGANHPAQYAAAAALSDERVEQDVVRMVAEFRKRRDLVVNRFRRDLLLLPRGLVRRHQRDRVLHAAHHHHRGGHGPGLRVWRRPLRADVVCRRDGRRRAGAREDHRVREKARRLEGRGKREEGRGKREEGRGKREEDNGGKMDLTA